MKQSTTRICFLADKHELYDDRIYWKMAVPLKRLGWDVYYYLIGAEADQGTTDEGIHFQILKVKTFSANRYLNFLLKRMNPRNNYKILFQMASDLKADIYHFHDLWINKIGGRLKRLPHRPVVFYDAREPYADDYRSYLSGSGLKNAVIGIFAGITDRWEKKKARKYDLIIANEEGVRDDFRRALGDDRSIVLYNYVDANLFKIDSSEIKKEYDFIYCGGVNEHRGIDVCIKALAALSEDFPASNMLVIGRYFPENYKKDLASLIRSLNLQGRVVLHDPVDHVKLPDLYMRSRIGLCVLAPIKTFERSLPIKLFEYMSFGLPIIGTRIGHIDRILEQDRTGITVDYFDMEELTRAMKELLIDDKLYDKMSANGRNATIERYNWQTEFDTLIKHYNQSLKRREAAPLITQ